MSTLPVICIMGPTASGKTALACDLYDRRADVSLISVDSALIYRDMNIGTAKPTPAELAQYPHALIDILDPTETYSAAQFVEDAHRLIQQSHAQGKIPVLVGGTLMYFNALLNGLSDLPETSLEMRLQLEQEAQARGWQALHDDLRQVDPQSAARFAHTDKQRLIRALEVYRLSGQALSSFFGTQRPYAYDYRVFALTPERALLHERIALRLDEMWANGLVDEVTYILNKYSVTPEMPSMRCVGYRQVIEYLTFSPDAVTIEEMKDKTLFASRQLAKRQMTWVRKLAQNHPINFFVNTKTALPALLLSI